MRCFEHCRRIATVALVGALLSVAPQIALAGYSTPKSAVQSVGTAALVAPTTVSGTWDCQVTGKLGDSFTVNITGLTIGGPAGVSFVVRVLSQTGVTNSSAPRPMPTPSAPIQVVGDQAKTGANTLWTTTVRAVLFQWSGPVISRDVTCDGTKRTQGSFP